MLINPEDFQVRAYIDQGRLQIRLILQGEKAKEVLRQCVFDDPHKEYLRQIVIEEDD